MTSRSWEKVLDHLKNNVSDQVFETWLRPLRFVSREGSLLLVATPHKFFKQWIEENYMPKLEEAARKELGRNISVEIVVGGDEDAEEGRLANPPELSMDGHRDAKQPKSKMRSPSSAERRISSQYMKWLQPRMSRASEMLPP